MSIEAMGRCSNRRDGNRSFARSALILAGCLWGMAILLCLLAIALEKSGTSGPWGVAAAASICTFAGLSAEALGALAQRAGSPLGALAVGMALRLVPLLAVCVVLGLNGGGRQHLAFVVYLLVFYFVTLTLDTWLALGRVAHMNSPNQNRTL